MKFTLTKYVTLLFAVIVSVTGITAVGPEKVPLPMAVPLLVIVTADIPVAGFPEPVSISVSPVKLTVEVPGLVSTTCNTCTFVAPGSLLLSAGLDGPTATCTITGVEVAVFVGVLLGVSVAVLAGVSVVVLDGVAVSVLLGVPVLIRVLVAVALGVWVSVVVTVAVMVLDGVNVGVPVLIRVLVGVPVIVLVVVLVGVLVGVPVLIRVLVGVELGV